MLNNPSDQVRLCHRHAENCARKAAAITDPKLKQDFLDLERSWLLLARSYDFGGRLTDFSTEAKRRVFYALHVRRTDGHDQVEHNRYGTLPTLGELIPVTLGGEQINIQVLNVFTSPPAKVRGELVHNVYSVEVPQQQPWFGK